jgi:hypothetical protein
MTPAYARSTVSYERTERGRPRSVRFPPSLVEAISERARQADRTFSGEVIHVLRRSLNASAGIDQDEIERLRSVYEATRDEVAPR